MVESMIRTEYPARSNGVDIARSPSGAVASILENDGTKKTIFFESRTQSPPPSSNSLEDLPGKIKSDEHMARNISAGTAQEACVGARPVGNGGPRAIGE